MTPMITITKVSSAPVTPDDSIVGASIQMTASFDEAFFGLQLDQRRSALVDNSSDELLVSILKHETLSHYQLSQDYLYSKDRAVSVNCRRKTCEWMYGICDYFKLNREVVAIAIFYVDRYFTLAYSRNDPVTTRQFQLVALTSLFIAIKTHGGTRQRDISVRGDAVEFNINFCASVSRNQFTPSEIEDCEQTLLRSLDWHVNPFVPSWIIETLISYLSPSSADDDENLHDIVTHVYDCSKYLAELSVSIPDLSMVCRPSVIAFASILYALDVIGDDKLSTRLKLEFNSAVRGASCCHFDVQNENIENALVILRVICPNLIEISEDQQSRAMTSG